MRYHKQDFLNFVLEEKLLRFGDFTTKSGRKTSYFFNVGNIQQGSKLKKLAQFYASFIADNHLVYPTIFGPAYKGISLAIATSMALSEIGHEINFSYNRKEAKNHGEGGNIIGAKLEKDILIIDDVITSGISIEESIRIIKSYNAVPKAAIVSLDRQEVAHCSNELTKNYLENTFNIKVYTMLELKDIIAIN